MSEKSSEVKLVEHDQLDEDRESIDKPKVNELTGLLNDFKKRFNVEFNGLFFIILSIIVFAAAVTIAMVLCIFFGPPQIRPHAGISTEVTECTAMGLEICRQGGTAVDSAIASLLCISIARPDIVGVGGCGSMVIHNHTSMKSTTIDFSCVAPPTATNATINKGFGVKESVAIPGVFSGLKLAHKNHGKMNWTTIISSVIQTATNGFQVTPPMTAAFSSKKFQLLPANFRNLYSNWATGSVFKPSPDLLNILLKIANEGLDTGISGSLSNEIVSLGFAWTGQFDTARKQKPLTAVFGDYSLFTAPLPSKGGLDLAIALEMLNSVVPQKALEKETTLFYHRLLESLKVSQALTSFLGDSNNGIEPQLLSAPSIQSLIKQMGVPTTLPNQNYGPYIYQAKEIESGSGTHISVVDSNSLYVSLSANLGSQFGSGIVTQSGIILNDAMRLFTPNGQTYLVPGTQTRNSTISNNLAAPGKRPLNENIPLIVYNFKRKCGVRFAVGGDHGTKSSTGNLQMIMGAIYLDQKFCPSKDCMELAKAGLRPRLHVDILMSRNPNDTAIVYFDNNFPVNFKSELISTYKHTNFNVTTLANTLNSIGKVQYEIQGFANSPGGKFVSF